jgi:uncharacterized OB-fold protein
MSDTDKRANEEQRSFPPPAPVPDPLTQFFWDAAAAGTLMIQRCNDCGKHIHPPRPICRACLSLDLAPVEVSGRATLYSWTIAEQAFHPYFADKLPYVYATVELEGQRTKLITNIVDCPIEDLRVDMPVEVVFEPLTDTITLPKFRPASA